jgi:8-oxo-dGTP pyrophosphatase MutT (NUDIX family)
MNTTDTVRQFGIPRENEERRDGGCAVVFDPTTQKYAVGEKANGGLYLLFSGGVHEGEDIQEGVLREVTEESGLYKFAYIEKTAEALTHYYNTSKNVNRVAHATCFLVILEDIDLVPQKLEAHEDFTLVWRSAKEVLKNWEERNQNKDYDHWIYFLTKGVARATELGYDKTSGIV